MIKDLLELLRNNSGLKITGTVTHVVRDENGNEIFRKVQKNTIQNQLKYRAAQHLGDGTYNYGVDALFTTSDTQAGAGEDGNDGVVISDGTTARTMITTKDSGGTGAENSVTFQGVYTNGTGGNYAATTLYLGRALDWTSAAVPFTTFLFASQSISVTIPDSAQYTVTWQITFG